MTKNMNYMTATPNNSINVLNNTLNSGGAEKNCVTICNELVTRNIDVELWITKLGNTPLIDQLDKRVKVISIPGKKVRYTFFHLKNQMRRSNSRTLLIFNIELLIPAFFINKIFNLNYKIVARSISTLSLSYNKHSDLGKIIWLKCITYTLNRIESIIAQSSGMKDDLVYNFKIQESKIAIIPNPAYILSYNTNNARVNNIHPKGILFVGRLTEAKGLLYLLNAFQLALKQAPDLHLTIVGDGELLQEIHNKTVELNIDEAISFEGYQSELIPYYKNAKATVLTSIREGFPNALVESISVGTPVISFDCPSGPKDIIIHGVNGILVEHLNVEEFARSIIDIVNGNITFDKEKVIQSATRFSLEKIIKQYEEVLFG